MTTPDPRPHTPRSAGNPHPNAAEGDTYEARWGFDELRRELLLKEVVELESSDKVTIRTYKVVSTHEHYPGRTWITDVTCSDSCDLDNYVWWSQNPVQARLHHAEVILAIINGAKTFDAIHDYIDR